MSRLFCIFSSSSTILFQKFKKKFNVGKIITQYANYSESAIKSQKP